MMDPPMFDLDEVAGQIIDAVRPALGEIHLIRELNSDARIPADREDLEKILMNLIINAQEAMPDGGTLHIQTQCIDLDEMVSVNGNLGPGSYALLQVSDTGNKIAADLLDKIFEPTRRLNGAISVESRVAQGTSVQIHIPCTPPVRRGPRLGRVRGNAETVLVVENEPAVRHLLVRTLRESGYLVLEAADGKEALSFIEADPSIRLLITDLAMPEMHGRRLAAAARERIDQLPVLFMSGYPSKPSEGVSENGGFLAKPFSLDSLIKEVQRLLPPDE